MKLLWRRAAVVTKSSRRALRVVDNLVDTFLKGNPHGTHHSC